MKILLNSQFSILNNNMPDILLIQPPIEDFYLTAKRTIPYGLACIASALMKSGFSVEIFDALASPKTRQLPIPPEMAFLARIMKNQTSRRLHCFTDSSISDTVLSISAKLPKHPARF